MRALDHLASELARWVLTALEARVTSSRREWLAAMREELDDVPGGMRRLGWALGGLRVALTSRRDAPSSGRGAFAACAASAVAAGTAVLALRALLEDSPYAFNLGARAPAGIHPDAGNPLSLAWDVVVLASVAEVAAMGAVAVCFLRLAAMPRDVDRRGHIHAMRVAMLAAALCLWIVAVAACAWGLAAHGSAAALFDHAPRGVPYLTRGSWIALTSLLAACAAVMTAAGAARYLMAPPVIPCTK